MAEVVWSDDALDHLAHIKAYIGRFDLDAAEGMVRRLAKLGDSLSDFPARGRPALDGTRELATAPPYILGYEVTNDFVTILYIRHGRQRPLA